MQRTMEMLVHGRPEIVEYYRKAAERWPTIWAKKESQEWLTLAELLPEEEAWFEKNCGGRWLGQEVMVVSGFASLYTTPTGFNGNLERARLLFSGIQGSFGCSITLKYIAERVATAYDVLTADAV